MLGLIYSAEINRCGWHRGQISLYRQYNQDYIHLPFHRRMNQKNRNYTTTSVCSPLYLIIRTKCMTEYHPAWKDRERRGFCQKCTELCIFFWIVKIYLKIMSHILNSEWKCIYTKVLQFWTSKFTVQVRLYKLRLTSQKRYCLKQETSLETGSTLFFKTTVKF